MKGHGCPKCYAENRGKIYQKAMRSKNIYPEWFIKDLEGSPDREAVLSYSLGTHDKARFICSTHGEYVQCVGDHLYKGSGCPLCVTGNYRSTYEKKLQSFIEGLGFSVQTNVRMFCFPGTTNRFELDLYIPEKKIAFEINGLYWHSDNYVLSKQIDYSKYHQMKTDVCHCNGIQLIHLFEDDLRDKFDLCAELVKAKLGVLKTCLYARNLVVSKVDNDLSKEFYNENHIQGYGNGITYGLLNGEDLVACISVKKCASNTRFEGYYELNRYATDSRYRIVGGLLKLMKYVECDLNVKSWVSYADKTVSDGSLYYRTGWVLDGVVPPDYMYIYKGCRYHKFNFRISRFRDDENLLYEDGKSELELASLNKIFRIYDSGKLRFVKHVQ